MFRLNLSSNYDEHALKRRQSHKFYLFLQNYGDKFVSHDCFENLVDRAALCPSVKGKLINMAQAWDNDTI